MRLFWQKGRKIRSTERFKTSAILNARFRESYFKLKVDGRAGAVWESRWTSWAVRPNEPSGFRGRKDLLHRASALVTTCP